MDLREALGTPFKKKIIVSKTGSGKTYTTIQFLKSIDKKSLFLVPFVSLKKQIIKEYNLSEDPKNKITVACPEKLNLESFKDKEIIVIDEIHLLLKSKIYRPIYRKLLKLFSDKEIIGLTGTPIITEDLKDFEVIELEKEKTERLIIKQPKYLNPGQLNKLRRRNSSLAEIYSIIEHLKENLAEDELIVVYANNKNLHFENIDLILSKETVDNEIFDLLINKRKVCKEVITKGLIPKGVRTLLFTDVFSTGLNIYNKFRRIHFIVLYDNTLLAEDVVQALSRFRRVKEFILYPVESSYMRYESIALLDNSSKREFFNFIRFRKELISLLKEYFKNVEISEEKILITLDFEVQDTILQRLKTFNYRMKFINFLIRECSYAAPVELLAAASYKYEFQPEESCLIYYLAYVYDHYNLSLEDLILLGERIYNSLLKIFKSPNQKFKAVALPTPNRKRLRINSYIIGEVTKREKEKFIYSEEDFKENLISYLEELDLFEDKIPSNLREYLKFTQQVLYKALGLEEELEYLYNAEKLWHIPVLKYIDKLSKRLNINLKEMPIFIPLDGKKPLIKWKEKGLPLYAALKKAKDGVGINIKSLGISYFDLDLKGFKPSETIHINAAILKKLVVDKYNIKKEDILDFRITPNRGAHLILKKSLNIPEKHKELIEYFKEDRILVISPEYHSCPVENIFLNDHPIEEIFKKLIRQSKNNGVEIPDEEAALKELLNLRNPLANSPVKKPIKKQEISEKSLLQAKENFKDLDSEIDKAMILFLMKVLYDALKLFKEGLDEEAYNLLSEYFNRFKLSKNYIAFSCPLHPPDKNPSAAIYFNKDYYCFVDFHNNTKLFITVEDLLSIDERFL